MIGAIFWGCYACVVFGGSTRENMEPCFSLTKNAHTPRLNTPLRKLLFLECRDRILGVDTRTIGESGFENPRADKSKQGRTTQDHNRPHHISGTDRIIKQGKGQVADGAIFTRSHRRGAEGDKWRETRRGGGGKGGRGEGEGERRGGGRGWKRHGGGGGCGGGRVWTFPRRAKKLPREFSIIPTGN